MPPQPAQRLFTLHVESLATSRQAPHLTTIKLAFHWAGTTKQPTAKAHVLGIGLPAVAARAQSFIFRWHIFWHFPAMSSLYEGEVRIVASTTPFLEIRIRIDGSTGRLRCCHKCHLSELTQSIAKSCHVMSCHVNSPIPASPLQLLQLSLPLEQCGSPQLGQDQQSTAYQQPESPAGNSCWVRRFALVGGICRSNHLEGLVFSRGNFRQGLTCCSVTHFDAHQVPPQ